MLIKDEEKAKVVEKLKKLQNQVCALITGNITPRDVIGGNIDTARQCGTTDVQFASGYLHSLIQYYQCMIDHNGTMESARKHIKVAAVILVNADGSAFQSKQVALNSELFNKAEERYQAILILERKQVVKVEKMFDGYVIALYQMNKGH